MNFKYLAPPKNFSYDCNDLRLNCVYKTEASSGEATPTVYPSENKKRKRFSLHSLTQAIDL